MLWANLGKEKKREGAKPSKVKKRGTRKKGIKLSMVIKTFKSNRQKGVKANTPTRKKEKKKKGQKVQGGCVKNKQKRKVGLWEKNIADSGTGGKNHRFKFSKKGEEEQGEKTGTQVSWG